MKKSLFLSLVALALASCSNDEFLGTTPEVQPPTTENTDVAIAFGGEALRPTRAGNEKTGVDAAKALNNNFIVYGFKTTAAEANDKANDKPVFDLFNVNYEEGTANTTESNTSNWEYVGYANHDGSIDPQAIKYWDLSANSYVFSAVSGTGIQATKILDGANSKYEKGWNIEVPAGGSLSDLYASDRLVATKAGNEAGVKGKYQDVITLTFRALGTKVRFAMYEVVPGYDVHIDRVFYVDENDDKKFSDTNFYIKGNFKTANTDAVTPLTVTYYDTTDPSVENRPKVTYDQNEVTCLPYGLFGSNFQTAEKLGESSTDATYDQQDKSYTMVLPYESKQETDAAKQENVLKLKVNFTLTSTDKSKEEIKVYGATAYVPTQYTQWKPNFAYTYIFKISDNANGTTVTPANPDDPDTYPDDPDDPGYDPDDPNIGLYPITFDAVVITDEEDVQETITTVAEPSITTYASGIIVTENDEYTAGTDVYVTVMKAGALQSDLAAQARVFEVYNYGDIEKQISEEVVDNYLNNYCVLIPISPAPDATVTKVPLTDGTDLTFAAGEVLKFTTAAGKVYAVQYAYTGADSKTKYAYKVIKVQGDKIPATYTFSVKSGSPITAMDGTAVLQLNQAAEPVIGATPNFVVNKPGLVIKPSATEGEYEVSLDPKAVAAGTVNGTYSIDFNDKSVDVEVNLAYALTTALTIEAGDVTGSDATLTISGAAANGDVTEVPAGITVKNTAVGAYNIIAASDMAAGDYTIKIAGKPLAITVKNYIFNVDALTMIKPYNDNAYANINLWDAVAGTSPAIAPSAITVTSTATGLAVSDANTPNNGQYTLTGSAGGVYTLTYNKTAAKCVVTVNEYSIATPEPPVKSTGKTNITVKCNGQAINANTASLVETAKPAGAVYTVTTNGKSITFSNASMGGDYKFDYKVDGVVVAQVTVTVID